jgi:thioredoxin reductase
MFFSTGQRQASDLARQLGCALTAKGAVRTGEYEASNIPGVYVAGDASKLVQLAIVAAAEGAQAAFAINTDLIKESGASAASGGSGLSRRSSR